MTKVDIIESVYAELKLSKKESTEIVELVLESVKTSLERGEKVKISGFGNFQVRPKKSRLGRNPQTGKQIEIPSRRVVSFRPSPKLRAAINAGPGPVATGHGLPRLPPGAR